jgi:digeranylgeranylglycerophospholipid reductase
MAEYDVIVVGGGPGGSTVAKIIAEAGFNVLVIEKKHLGRDKVCAGGISIRTLEKLNLGFGDFVERKISGMRMYSPDNSVIEHNDGKTNGITVYRKKFDSYLLQLAITAGAEILTNTMAKDIIFTNNSNATVIERGNVCQKITGKLIIAADGVFSIISKKAGLYSYSKNHLMICAQYEMEMNERDIDELIGDNIELYFGENIAPGGYGWIFPKKQGITVGLGIRWVNRRKVRDYLNTFVLKHPIASNKLKNAKILSKAVGVVPLEGVIGKTYSDNLLIVGDAAGQVSTLTGEGIYYSMISAKKAATVAIEALSENNFSKNKLKKYEKEWKKEICADLKWGILLRNLLLLEDKRINYLVKEAKNNEILKIMLADLISGAAPYNKIIIKNYKTDLPFLFKGFVKRVFI